MKHAYYIALQNNIYFDKNDKEFAVFLYDIDDIYLKNIIENKENLKIKLSLMKKEKKEFERTIDESLFDTIKMLRRIQDASELTETTGFSRPTIDKALNFGHIRDSNLETAIVEFYTKRASRQREDAERILKILTNKK